MNNRESVGFSFYFGLSLYVSGKACYNILRNRGFSVPSKTFTILHFLKERPIAMMTVLFTVIILAAFGFLFSAMDNQRVSSNVCDYLRSEYRMRDTSTMTYSGLRNL